MASVGYLKLAGQKQGSIKGPITQKGRTGAILVIGTHHQVSAPRDAATGLASGKRIHRALVITKEIDQSTPLLYSALVTNEAFSEWALDFWRPNPSGVEEAYFTIKLSKASIASIEFVQPNAKHPESTKLIEYEDVAFTYQRIEWTWTKGSISAMDDWSGAGG